MSEQVSEIGGRVPEPPVVIPKVEPRIVIKPVFEPEGGVLDFSYELAVGEENQLKEKMPWDGYVVDGSISYPDGCNDLVGVRITVDGKRLVPLNTQWMAYNNVVMPVTLLRRVKKDRLIVVDMKNNDTVNPHLITVSVNIYNYLPVPVKREVV